MVALAAPGHRRLDFLFDWRNKILASPRFQRWAAGFPFTAWIARREARALFDLCAGFVYAQVLSACIELNLFEQLARGPLGVAALAQRNGLTKPAMRLLLNAAASLRLAEPAGAETFRLGRLGAALRGNPGIAAMVRHHRLFYGDLADPLALLRGQAETRLAKFWPYQDGGGEPAAYSELMAASQNFIADEILDRYDFTRHRRVLDLGGGDGAFLAALAVRAPQLNLQLFDLPAVAARARARFAAAGMTRAESFGGSFLADEMPPGADLITLIRVLHDHDDAAAMRILGAAYAALPPGGVLLVAEPMAGGKHGAAMGDAYFSFYLLAMGSGRPRRPTELTAMLGQAGFAAIRNIATRQPILTGLIIAHKKV